MRWESLLVISVASGGCGLHLHNSADHSNATKAVTTFNEVDFETIMTDSRRNASALTEVERDNRRRLSAVGTRLELQAIIADPSAWTPDEQTSFVGWAKIKNDTKIALGNNDDDVTQRRVAALRIFRDELEFEEVEYEDQVRHFHASYPDSRLPTGLEEAPRDETELAALLDGVPAPEAADYRDLIFESIVTLLKLRNDVMLADQAIRSAIASEDEQVLYGELETTIADLERRTKARSVQLKTLGRSFEEARRQFKEREAQLSAADRPAPSDDPAEPRRGDTPAEGEDDALLDRAKTLIDLARQAQDADAEALFRQMASAIIVELMARLDAAVAEDGSAVALAGHALLNAMNDPEIRRQILGEHGVSINQLLLELAAHRQAYELARARDEFDRRLLDLKRLQHQALSNKYRLWARVATRLQSLEANGIAPDNVAAFVSGDNVAVALSHREEVITAMVAYAQARIYEGRYRELRVDEHALHREQHFRRSEIALRTWKDFVAAPLAEIATYHEGGITSEEIASLLNAAGLAAIAVGVN